MASSQSTGGKYANITFFKQENFPMLAKQMMMKQQTVDTTTDMLDQFNERMGTDLQAAKEQDRNYIANRVMQGTGLIQDSLNNGLDISDQNNMRSLKAQFNSVVDEKVLNAVSSYKLGQAEELKWQELAEKNPEKYNAGNKRFAQQNWNEYMANPEVGAKYKGGGGVIEYVDPMAKLQDPAFFDFLENIGLGGEFIEMVKNSGDLITTINSYEGMREEDIPKLRQAIQMQVGQDGYRQLNIDAWNKYGNGDDIETVNSFVENYSSERQIEIDELQRKIDAREKEIVSKGYKGEELKEHNKEVGLAKNKLSKLREIRNIANDVITKDGVNKELYKNLYSADYINNFNNNAAGLLFKDKILTDTNLDEVEFKTANYKLALRRAFEEEQKSKPSEDRGAFATGERKEIDDLTTKNAEEEYISNTRKSIDALNNFVPEGTTITEGHVDLLMTKMMDKDFWTKANAKGYVNLEGVRIDVTKQGAVQSIMGLQSALTGNNDMGNKIKSSLNTVSQNSFNTLVASTGTRELKALSNSLEDLAFTPYATGYRMGKKTYQEGKGNLEYLLDKHQLGTLTEDEKATLEVYNTILTANSTEANLNDFDKDMMMKGMRESLLKNNPIIRVPSVNTIPKEIRVKSLEQAKEARGYDFWTENPVAQTLEWGIMKPARAVTDLVSGFVAQQTTGDPNAMIGVYNKRARDREHNNSIEVVNQMYDNLPGMRENFKYTKKALEEKAEATKGDIRQSSLRVIQVPYADDDGNITQDYKEVRDFFNLPSGASVDVALSPHSDNPDMFDIYVSSSISNSIKVDDEERKSYKVPGWNILTKSTSEEPWVVSRKEVMEMGLGAQLSDVKGISFNSNDVTPRELDLGSSAFYNNYELKQDKDNMPPTTTFYEKYDYVNEQYKNIPEEDLDVRDLSMKHIMDEYEKGNVYFKLSAESGDNYGVYMTFTDINGKVQTPLVADMGSKTLYDNVVENRFFERGLQITKDDIFLTFLGFGNE